MREITQIASQLRKRDRRALAAAITLVESNRPEHRASAVKLCDILAQSRLREAIRIGISGTPGAGKSTMIDTIGGQLLEQGKSVAVLAIDPSSTQTGGSILGDKTRMGNITNHPDAFIRPSPTNSSLGGMAARSREVVFLCEQAGYDYLLIETTGVGQSETAVADLSDMFVLLVAPAGGDELQGVKRGIVEFADLLVVNKADGSLRDAALATAAEYGTALRLHSARQKPVEGFPKVLTASATDGSGIDEFISCIEQFIKAQRTSGRWTVNRRAQDTRWLRSQCQQLVLAAANHSELIRACYRRVEDELMTGNSVFDAAVQQQLTLLEEQLAKRLGGSEPGAG